MSAMPVVLLGVIGQQATDCADEHYASGVTDRDLTLACEEWQIDVSVPTWR